ncbi:hypothetical protein LB504_003885 [Fusarium proliferatum]|nr:hypothetical protein LB504_003885 [Fusarium proliferatum]
MESNKAPAFSHRTHDYVVNEYETKDFVAGRTRSSEGLWRKVHTKGFDAVIWEFNPGTIQRPYPFYAPCPAGPGAKRLPAYIRIEAKNKEHQSLFQNHLKKDFFVSLFALIVLGSSQEINWSRETKEMESESELSAWQKSEEEFLKRTNDWKPNFMEGFPKIPVRTESGDIDTVQLSKEWQGWHDILPQMGVLDTASKHKGKPVRHLNISLRSPILIKPLRGSHEAMISKRFSMTPDKFFQRLIDVIHNTSDPDSQNPNHYPWKLQIHPEQKQEGYIMTSHDPFNLYETYIHQKDWNTYMESLEKTGSSIRPFPRVNQKLYDLCNGIMLKVGGADIALQASMKKESGKSHDSEDEDLKNLKEKYPKKVPRPFNNLKAKARALAEKKREKRRKSVKALNKVYEVGCGTAILWNDLDVDKIQRAAGKRPDEASQKEIMGGLSATEVSCH